VREASKLILLLWPAAPDGAPRRFCTGSRDLGSGKSIPQHRVGPKAGTP